jgi:hypothetical protein
MSCIAIGDLRRVASASAHVHNAGDGWTITSDLPCAALVRDPDAQVLERRLPGRLGRYVLPRDAVFASAQGDARRHWEALLVQESAGARRGLVAATVARGDSGRDEAPGDEPLGDEASESGGDASDDDELVDNDDDDFDCCDDVEEDLVEDDDEYELIMPDAAPST